VEPNPDSVEEYWAILSKAWRRTPGREHPDGTPNCETMRS
jgi:hypothetical protein